MRAPAPIYQLKITLMDAKPPIWRRILVSANVSLDIFHLILQETMGWMNEHLHQFTAHGASYGPRFNDLSGELEYEDEARYRLSQLLNQEKDSLKYEYDFGDSWEHKITLEKILPHDSTVQVPVCIKGKRNGPPEDCGGVWGYDHLVEILSNPGHPEYQHMSEWLGSEFDPEHFDLDEINAALRTFHPKSSKKKSSAT